MQENNLLLNIVKRISLGIMIPIGLITLIPNIMLIGSGSNQIRSIASNIGVLSSYIFITGGIIGSYKLGLLAMILQISTFGLLKINENQIKTNEKKRIQKNNNGI